MQSRQYDLSPLDIQVKVKDIIIQLKEIRIEKGLSQQKVAEGIGVRKGTICDMENFKYLPKLDLVVKYSNFLGYKLELKLQ